MPPPQASPQQQAESDWQPDLPQQPRQAPGRDPRQKPEILTGVLDRERWRPTDNTENHFVIATLESGETVKGDAPPGELVCGMAYRFFGNWEQAKPHDRYPPAFRFKEFAKSEPVSPGSLQTYLIRHAPGIGPKIAAKLWAKYGPGAVKMLRTEPAEVAREISGLTLEKTTAAAAELQKIAGAEDLRIELGELLSGRGFSRNSVDAVIRRWGLLAAAKIRKNPFHLMQAGIPGAGFLRCDRLYLDLGLPPASPVRQVYALEYWMSRDSEGHTWFSAQQAARTLGACIGSAQPDLRKAVKIGHRLRRIVCRTDEAGQVWVATWEGARAEVEIVAHLLTLTKARELTLTWPEPRRDAAGQALEDLDAPTPGGSPGEDGPEAQVLARIAAAGRDAFEIVEELRAAGRATGICQVCGRTLVAAESLAAGVGPVCGGRVREALEVAIPPRRLL